MIKIIKRTVLLLSIGVLAFLGIRFGPTLVGMDNIEWVSRKFSETLREKNELIVYEVEITGQETVTQEAWLIGTVQKVILPYTFTMDFTVDLSKAVVSVKDQIIEVQVPKPVAAHPKLVVDESRIQKVDWLYPLTAERYAETVAGVEQKFFTDCASNPSYQEAAWNTTVFNLQKLLDSVAGQSRFEIKVVYLPESK